MSSKLSYRMVETLRELARYEARGEARTAGNTNATLNALEERGLVRSEYDETRPAIGGLYPKWLLTDAGRDALEV